MNLKQFVAGSNRIEGIHREPTDAEIAATEAFIARLNLTIANLVDLVAVYQPNAVLRDSIGLDVRVGNHYPPRGGPQIVDRLQILLDDAHLGTATPFSVHVAYETLHPFTDGNGRSGRTLWLWRMRRSGYPLKLDFLHHFYYQTLDAVGR